MTTAVNVSVLRNSFLYRGTDESVLQQVAAYCQPMELLAGDTLFEQDSEPDSMYFLEDGQIHVVRRYPEGYEVIIATEVPYYVIGELSMLANQPRTGSVVAVGDCNLVRLSRDAVFEICEMFPEVAINALTHLGGRLYSLNLRVRESAIGNISARIASMLLMMTSGTDAPVTNVSVTRVARATALDPDVVERLLRQWHQIKVIEYANHQLRVQDHAELRKIAG